MDEGTYISKVFFEEFVCHYLLRYCIMKHHIVACGCVTVLIIFGNGTHASTITSWKWHLLHCKAALSSCKEQGEREDPQPDSFVAVAWTDCPGSSRKNHQTTGQGVCCILT